MSKVKVLDRVLVTAGIYKGKTGIVQNRRSNLYVVVFDGGGHAQLAATSLKRVTA